MMNKYRIEFYVNAIVISTDSKAKMKRRMKESCIIDQVNGQVRKRPVIEMHIYQIRSKKQKDFVLLNPFCILL